MLKYETGVLAATTAFGKTVVAAWLIAQRAVNTLVLVHRRQLLNQWIERLSTFLVHLNRRRLKRVVTRVVGLTAYDVASDRFLTHDFVKQV